MTPPDAVGPSGRAELLGWLAFAAYVGAMYLLRRLLNQPEHDR